MSTELPPSVQYGYVTARVILAIGDTPSDPDRHPDGIAPTGGKIEFKPVATILATNPPNPTLVLKQTVAGTIDPATGLLHDTANTAGVWLVTGQYSVSITTGTNSDPAKFLIQVTTAHTESNPLDLTLHIPQGQPGPIPQWQLLTSGEYNALPAHDLDTLYLIRRTV